MTDSAGNDPRITAYVLGELSDAERAEVEALCASDPAMAATVAEVRMLAERLADHFAAEPVLSLSDQQRQALRAAAADAVLPTAPAAGPTSHGRQWQRWALAATVLFMLAGGTATWWKSQDNRQLAGGDPIHRNDSAAVVSEAAPDARLATASQTTDDAPLPAPAAFSLQIPAGDAGTATSDTLEPTMAFAPPPASEMDGSAGNRERSAAFSSDAAMAMDLTQPAAEQEAMQPAAEVVQLLHHAISEQGVLLPPDRVPIEQLINTLSRGDKRSTVDSSESMTVDVDLVQCPWNADRWLMRVLFRNLQPTLAPTLQIAFNPSRIASFQRIGNTPLDGAAHGELIDVLVSDQISAATPLTLLYELVPRSTADDAAEATNRGVSPVFENGGDGALVAVQLGAHENAVGTPDGRMVIPGGAVRSPPRPSRSAMRASDAAATDQVVADQTVVDFTDADPELRFLIAVAGWARKLQQDPALDAWSFQQIATEVAASIHDDPSGLKAELARLIQITADADNGQVNGND